uniref:Uncharacterized protein n=1 Tax=Mycolicibacterium neoaurum VKM Ac-1815D TaxID=700508 RepID=V5XH65_MYCNE
MGGGGMRGGGVAGFGGHVGGGRWPERRRISGAGSRGDRSEFTLRM